MVRNSPANNVVFGLLSFLVARILDTINMVLFCQFELKMAVYAVKRSHAEILTLAN